MNPHRTVYFVIVLAATLTAGAQIDQSSRDKGFDLRKSQDKGSSSVLNVTLSKLLSSPDQFKRDLIQVRARVGERRGPHTFTLYEKDWMEEPELWVLVPVLDAYAMGRVPEGSAEGDPVTVTGELRRFDRGNFERDYDWFSINLFRNDALVRRLEGKPILVAHSILTQSGRELVDQEASGWQAVRFTTGSRKSAAWTGSEPIQDLRTLFQVRDRAELLRMRVILDAVEVQQVLGPRDIMVGTPSAQQVLVRLPRRSPRVQIGDFIHLDGVVHRMPNSPLRIGANAEQVSLAERRDLYISADRVEVVQP